jgi:methylated-DNA-protein-cysteine methyltransferase related protein
MAAISERYRAIYAVVLRIPEGRVATYGQVARLAGMPGQARLVGYALSALSGRIPVPWHRVVNAQGRISGRSGGSSADQEQRLRLENEGVRFDALDRIPLDQYLWQP